MSGRITRKREYYYRLAKQAGYRSRAAFKLLQLDEKYKLMREGDVVVDLGAAPGGWLQVILGRVGEEGFAMGVDLEPIRKFRKPNVKLLKADILDRAAPALIRNNLPRPADVVLSDASPRISGVWDIDHARSMDLARAALRIAEKVLRPGGSFVVKAFQGAEFGKFLSSLRKRFGFIKVSKPFASRKGSAEVYVVGKGFRG